MKVNGKREVIVDEEFKMKRGKEEAKCNVRIVKGEGRKKYEVMLSKPTQGNYSGVSVTNFIEHFATEIKKTYLPFVFYRSIQWIEYQESEIDEFNNIKLAVSFKRVWRTLSDPEWEGVLA